MTFLDEIFSRLEKVEETVLWELHDQSANNKVSWGVTGPGLLKRISQARSYLASRNLKRGDRCALLAANGIDWIALDLAIMAEGLIVVPLYSRQAPAELVSMMKDCSPSLICCGDESLRSSIINSWPEARPQALFEEIFAPACDA